MAKQTTGAAATQTVTGTLAPEMDEIIERRVNEQVAKALAAQNPGARTKMADRAGGYTREQIEKFLATKRPETEFWFMREEAMLQAIPEKRTPAKDGDEHVRPGVTLKGVRWAGPGSELRDDKDRPMIRWSTVDVARHPEVLNGNYSAEEVVAAIRGTAFFREGIIVSAAYAVERLRRIYEMRWKIESDARDLERLRTSGIEGAWKSGRGLTAAPAT